MLDWFAQLGGFESLLLGSLSGSLLAAGLTAFLLRRLQKPARDEAVRLRKSLRVTQVQLDQARKNAEALEIEVLEWRRRSALRQNGRQTVNSRFASSKPVEPDAWVIGALLGTDPGAVAGRDFADTQIMPSAAH